MLAINNDLEIELANLDNVTLTLGLDHERQGFPWGFHLWTGTAELEWEPEDDFVVALLITHRRQTNPLYFYDADGARRPRSDSGPVLDHAVRTPGWSRVLSLEEPSRFQRARRSDPPGSCFVAHRRLLTIVPRLLSPPDGEYAPRERRVSAG